MQKRESNCVQVEKWIDGLTDEQLGALVREYVQEANHTAWDGWEWRRLKGALTLLLDVKLYWTNSGKTEWGAAPWK